MKINSKFRYEGEWWLPENPERKINGELEYDGKGIILSLKDDIFQENKNDKAHTIGANYPNMPIILGKAKESEVENGISFTLYNLSVIGSDVISGYKYCPHIVFKGMLFHKKEDIKFKKIIADFSHIGRFFGNFKPPKVLLSPEGLEITYKKPLPIEISINSMCKILIKKDFKLKSIPGEVPVLLQEGTTVETAFPEEKNLDNSLKFLWLFNSFLSFLIGSIVHPLEIKGYTEENSNNFVEIFYRVFPLISETRSLTSSYLISYKFGDFFRNWFEKADTLEPVYNLYIRILNTLYPFSATDFILLVEAIEVYHRRAYNGKHLPDDDYKKEVEKLFEGASSNIQFLKDRVGYSNEWNLRKRLKQIFEKQGKILGLFIKDTDRFINCVVENRNYYVHYNEENKKEKKEILSGVKLYWLFIAVKILLEVCLLKDLGKYEDEEIKKLLDIRYSYQIFKIKESIFQ